MLHQTVRLFQYFLKNSRQLYAFFILVNLIPSILLLFTEPYPFIGKVLLIGFPLGIYLLIFASLKNIGLMQLLLIPQLVLNAFQIVIFYLFGESVIAVDMFLNLATTNVSEAGELLNNLWPAIFLVCLLYLPTIVFAIISCKKKIHLSKKFRQKAVILGLIIALASYGLTFTVPHKPNGAYRLQYDVFPINIYYNLHLAIQKWQRSKHYPVSSKDFSFHAYQHTQIPDREIYVLVIGEASRAANWSLWGYERETNPLLSTTSGLVLYPDAITQANATHKSVPLILSAVHADNFKLIYQQKSLITAFREADFKTIFISNQPPNRSFTDYFAAEADFHENIRPTLNGGISSLNNWDGNMLPLVQHYIDSLPGNLFFVLHTYGSHFNYQERYPSPFAHFKPDHATEIEAKNRQQLINAYDNSIRYTDYFLHCLIQTLNSTQAVTALYYSPDHGEDLLDDERKRFLHASPHPTYYQLHIPLLLWFSEAYQHTFPDRYAAAWHNRSLPVSTSSAFHTLLDMASINTPWLNTEYSLTSPKYKAQRRMYLNDHDQAVYWYQSGLKKQDREMIEKKKLDHR